MGDKESLVGVILGSYKLWSVHNRDKDAGQFPDDLLQSLKKYFQESKLGDLGFSFMDGAPLLSVSVLDEFGFKKVSFSLVLAQRLSMDHRPAIMDWLKEDLGAVGVSVVFFGALPGEMADVTDHYRFEREDVRAEYEALVNAIKKAGSGGLSLLKAFLIKPETRPEIRDALIHSMLSKKKAKITDGNLLPM